MTGRFAHILWLALGLLLMAPAGRLMAQPSADDMEFKALMSSARAYKNQDKMVRALEALGKAEQWAQQNENVHYTINTHHMYAQVYLQMGKPQEAETHYDSADILLENLDYNYGSASHLFLYAQFQFLAGLPEFALELLGEVKKLSNDRNLLNRVTLLEGKIYKQRTNWVDEAITRFNALTNNNDEYEKDFLRTQAHLELAEIYTARGENENAIRNGEIALRIAQANEFSGEFRKANRLMADLYERSGMYEMALTPIQNLLKLSDSLYTRDKLEAENRAASKEVLEQLSNTVDKLRSDLKEVSESANRSEIATILTSAFLTIISLLAVSLYRNNQIKLRTNDLLQTKNRELQLARDAAVQAMEAKTNFLSTVSHELRTPLYAVTGLTHLLLEENPRNNQLEHLKALKFSGDYLLNFINDILQINKIDADKLEPLEVDTNLKKVLTDVVNSLQQSARDRNNQLILDYDPQIPAHLMSDPVKLSQVFMNLVGNALKFTRDGEVVIIAKLLEKSGDTANVYFEIRDNGIGIEKDRQANIFDSFEQGSIQINREYGGTGLGLTIVKSLLGLFGSQIQLESELGKGSSFFFELKMKCRDDLIDDIPFEISREDYQYDGLHLLVVEDNKINQVITRKMLNKKGISCDIANNGTEAIDLARNNDYDGILMDIHMPGISGVEATEEIRRFNPDTPIIALTAISLDDSLEAFYAAGCNDVVTKPFKPDVFYEKIGEHMVAPKMRKSLS
ncbi:tetratricopeptide repeat-containing hybrid sensor histidine kinase/response regulator [Robiginitalea marina]|uniref:histidine kinase n=1 Tax=Robiginitalea marina TaxID=2954105 RepID=A0ABT1B0B8_9FLAO|nr:response regulator [Robiginitalea marina]MCO5724843.1 response regulator [Robiginitalea marina]